MDYELTLKVRNAPLLNAMRNSGYENAAQFSRASGIGEVTIGKFLNLKKAAYGSDGITPLPTVIKMSECLGVPVEDMFPEKNLLDPLVKNVFITQVSEDQLQQLEQSSIEPSRLLEHAESADFDALIERGITDREKLVLKSRFVDELSLQETTDLVNQKAKSYHEKHFKYPYNILNNICRGRVQQIQMSAIRKLRDPEIREKLMNVAGVHGEDFEDKHQRLLNYLKTDY